MPSRPASGLNFQASARAGAANLLKEPEPPRKAVAIVPYERGVKV